MKTGRAPTAAAQDSEAPLPDCDLCVSPVPVGPWQPRTEAGWAEEPFWERLPAGLGTINAAMSRQLVLTPCHLQARAYWCGQCGVGGGAGLKPALVCLQPSLGSPALPPSEEPISSCLGSGPACEHLFS